MPNPPFGISFFCCRNVKRSSPIPLLRIYVVIGITPFSDAERIGNANGKQPSRFESGGRLTGLSKVPVRRLSKKHVAQRIADEPTTALPALDFERNARTLCAKKEFLRKLTRLLHATVSATIAAAAERGLLKR